jgi:hypothetical protein
MTPAESFKKRNFGEERDNIKKFYEKLSYEVGAAFLESVNDFDRIRGKERERLSKIFGEAIINPSERLSIPELVKPSVSWWFLGRNRQRTRILCSYPL